MSEDFAVRVENLGKKYVIQHEKGPSYLTLRDVIAGRAKRAGERLVRPLPGRTGALASAPSKEEFWAIRELDFTVQRGERVGIIGRNGAGKSTLFKVLSRITEPTTGRMRIRGRVASLLEIGTGFHGELSGRENIYLNGAVLGMGRAEIQRKFDDIVEFAEVEQFLDTPVKRYSTGMYVRLAFAIAAQVEPDILIVDEVLAVGDAAFQQKCLNTMRDLGEQGRTLLFVSHDMTAITRLCDRALLLDGGQMLMDGPSPAVAAAYLDTGRSSGVAREWTSAPNSPGDEVARLRRISMRTASTGDPGIVDIQDPIEIDVEYRNYESSLKTTVELQFYNMDGICLFSSNDFNNQAWWNTPRRAGMVCATCRIPGNFFAEGGVRVHVSVSTHNPRWVHAQERDVLTFHVIDRSDGNSVRGPYGGQIPGVVRPMLEWNVHVDEDQPALQRDDRLT